jgi:prepilin-type N-terminal cleavage/methylation domain-containing protein
MKKEGIKTKGETMKTQSRKAFTMVELAIVLVIIGLIMGAVLKGQELINNAKQKRLYSLKQEISAAILTYYDKFSAYPGDDPQATSHVGDSTKNGDGDGFIDGGFVSNCSNHDKESCALWEHLRLANILSGSGVTNPRNPYGGAVSVAYTGIHNKYANWIRFDNLPEEVTKSIDEKYDDGKYDTGSIRASGSSDYNITDNKDRIRALYFEF